MRKMTDYIILIFPFQMSTGTRVLLQLSLIEPRSDQAWIEINFKLEGCDQA